MSEATQRVSGAKPAAGAAAERQEFLTFTLGREEYGIEILKVQEIRSYEAVTTIANAPEFIKGVVNLRGTIVPIVDMRIKFNLGEVDYTQFTVVIKSLESNYRKVRGVSGATIMGDGRVALILDVEALVRMSRRDAERQAA